MSVSFFSVFVTHSSHAALAGCHSGAIPGHFRYLNHGCDNTGDGVWQNFYANEPLQYVPKDITPAKEKLIVGGETTMWAECVDAVIFDSIVWPRAAAAAEKLWSPKAATGAGTCTLHASTPVSNHRCHLAGCALKVPAVTCNEMVSARMAEHRCRMVANGVSALPLVWISSVLYYLFVCLFCCPIDLQPPLAAPWPALLCVRVTDTRIQIRAAPLNDGGAMSRILNGGCM
eukprot:COSAG01_NODE_7089_length_3358_cov_14.827554_4_plen_230_part_00